jgi:hypothetical protein
LSRYTDHVVTVIPVS